MKPHNLRSILHQQTPSQRVPKPEAFAVWFILSIVYLLTLAGNHTESEDALQYLSDIRSDNASAISHPHHLAYGWYGWAAYHAALALGYNGGPLIPLQVLNTFTGALGIAVLWILLRTVVPGRIATVFGCGFLAFSYGYWWYSVEVEVYILSTLLLICSLLLAYHAVMNPSLKSFALLGGTQGLAVLAHNTNVLFTPVIALTLFFASRSLPSRDVLRDALAYAGASIAIVVPSYVLAIVASGLRTTNEAYDWLTLYAQSGNWGNWDTLSLPKAAFGFGRALVGGHFAFALDSIREVTIDSFSDKSLREEFFLVRDFPNGSVLLLLALVVVLALALLLPLLRWLRRPVLDNSAKVLAMLCISWLIPYVLFFVWWEPHNIEFWIAPWVPVTIIFALAFSSYQNQSRGRFLPSSVVILLAVLFSVNFLGSIWPQHSAEDDYWRVRTSWYEHNTTSSDLVVTTGRQMSLYLRYFSPAQVIDVEGIFVKHNDTAKVLTELEHRIEKARARRTLFSKEVFYPDSDKVSNCYNDQLCDEWAPAMRNRFLPRTHIVADVRLEKVRELNE